MSRAGQTAITMRVVIDRPFVGVPYSLQGKDGGPLDAKCSETGEALAFDFPVCIAPGPRFLGDQVRREGPTRRFVYIRIGQLAGDPASPWSRRIKIDIHDIDPALLERAMADHAIVETRIVGTGDDGTPACATIPPTARQLIRDTEAHRPTG